MRGKGDIMVSGWDLYHTYCCLCGPKKRKQRGNLHLILHFVALHGRNRFERHRGESLQVLHVLHDLRIAGDVCLPCAKKLASRLDAAIDDAETRRYA